MNDKKTNIKECITEAKEWIDSIQNIKTEQELKELYEILNKIQMNLYHETLKQILFMSESTTNETDSTKMELISQPSEAVKGDLSKNVCLSKECEHPDGKMDSGADDDDIDANNKDNDVSKNDSEYPSETCTDLTVDSNNSDGGKSLGDSEPAYAVFYSVKNAAYISLDERLRTCVPVRNLAKAYCIGATINEIANGQNELSKYRLEKLKPIEIKFLTQKEYDDSIGKALAMTDLIKSMPTMVTDNALDDNRKVTNFVSKSSPSNSHGNHIGSKSTSQTAVPIQNNTSYRSMDDDTKPEYHSYAYGSRNSSSTTSHKVNTDVKEDTPSIYNPTVTHILESPKAAYKWMHNGIDSIDIDKYTYKDSYQNDLWNIISMVKTENIEDFDILIRCINRIINNISVTKSAWLVNIFMHKQVMAGEKDNPQYVYMERDDILNMDFAKMNDAIERWNQIHPDTKIMYIEEFDPTIIHFKDKISVSSTKFVVEESEMMAMAIYNYVRCLIAYEEAEFKKK